MTDYAARFAASFPKAIDFPEKEYRENAGPIDDAAKANLYHLAGFRLGFAVFSSKEVDDAGNN